MSEPDTNWLLVVAMVPGIKYHPGGHARYEGNRTQDPCPKPYPTHEDNCSHAWLQSGTSFLEQNKGNPPSECSQRWELDTSSSLSKIIGEIPKGLKNGINELYFNVKVYLYTCIGCPRSLPHPPHVIRHSWLNSSSVKQRPLLFPSLHSLGSLSSRHSTSIILKIEKLDTYVYWKKYNRI